MDGFSLAECLSGISRSGLGDASFFDKVVAFIEPRTLSFDPISTSRIAFSLACVRDHIPQLASTFDKLSLQVCNFSRMGYLLIDPIRSYGNCRCIAQYACNWS
uniref:Uncharacterized protein n=1 Tax=Spongospora subterranea TaxID=70186 RepID=A0A0H5RG79_9EUKA|eukprot:CRZ12567.1 hypothetical protein [Spongospora subterranea]